MGGAIKRDMSKESGNTKTFLMGCCISMVFIILYKISDELEQGFHDVFVVIGLGFLVLSMPWTIPVFLILRELEKIFEWSIASYYIEPASIILGFGLNYLILLKFGIRSWLVSVWRLALVVVMLGVLFTVWMILR